MVSVRGEGGYGDDVQARKTGPGQCTPVKNSGIQNGATSNCPQASPGKSHLPHGTDRLAAWLEHVGKTDEVIPCHRAAVGSADHGHLTDDSEEL